MPCKVVLRACRVSEYPYCHGEERAVASDNFSFDRIKCIPERMVSRPVHVQNIIEAEGHLIDGRKNDDEYYSPNTKQNVEIFVDYCSRHPLFQELRRINFNALHLYR